jgi:hypothetical protein
MPGPAGSPSARNLDFHASKPSLTVFCGICAFFTQYFRRQPIIA